MNDLAANPHMVSANDVVAGKNDFEDRSFAAHGNEFDISEATPFLGTDDVILGLLKDYLNAKADYQGTLLSYGSDNPMTEIAADHADSAWCALQARLFELKADKAAAARAKMLEKINNNTCEARQESRSRRLKAEREELRATAYRRRRRIERRNDDGNWILFILFLMANRESGWLSRWLPPLPSAATGAA